MFTAIADFVTNKVVERGFTMIDKAFYTDQEKAEDKQLVTKAAVDSKVKLLEAYHPFKKTQRVLAYGFIGVYIFIMLNGVLVSLFGIVDVDSFKDALDFANEMYLGEISLTIIVFYFGGGVVDSFKRRQ